MNDSNKISIKIRQQSIDDRLINVEQAEMVTVWHVKRILVAVIFLLSIILLLIYFFTRETVEQKTENDVEIESTKAVVNIKEHETVKKAETKQTTSIIKHDKSKQKIKGNADSASSEMLDVRVVRALLSKGLNNREPLGKIKTPLLVTRESAIGVYYFTEIVKMKGQVVYHQWIWNNHEVYKKRIKIWGDRWRASTSKLIPYSKSGSWRVRLINKEGDVLNEIKFEVVKD